MPHKRIDLWHGQGLNNVFTPQYIRNAHYFYSSFFQGLPLAMRTCVDKYLVIPGHLNCANITRHTSTLLRPLMNGSFVLIFMYFCLVL